VILLRNERPDSVSICGTQSSIPVLKQLKNWAFMSNRVLTDRRDKQNYYHMQLICNSNTTTMWAHPISH
jgi:hypothetical protein